MAASKQLTVSGIPAGLRGRQLLETPEFNKGTAFSAEERHYFGLDGLLPPIVETLEEQAGRAYNAYLRKEDDLERHIYLRALQDTNEVLFYRLLLEHIEEMVPIIYTPVVAEACLEFSHIYRRPRGLILPYPLRDSIGQLLRNRPNRNVAVIVVTDGERILGIGDQGVGGLGIPIGKLSLYTLIGGIPPAQTLPILLDAGTNNADALADPEYLGWRHERVTGDAYYEFVDRFVQALKRELPGTLLQWEDFAQPHARPLLNRYRDELLTFNDDIQGTAAVATGAILAGVGATGQRLRDQHIAIFGAGAAAIGVAEYLYTALIQDGLSREEARQRFWLFNSKGLLHSRRTDLTAEQAVYAQPMERLSAFPRNPNTGRIGFEGAMREIRATILIGLSTLRGAFSEPMVREMARKVERPMIFPLSNPSAKSEAVPEDLVRWTEGRALVATGSPYAPVAYDGRNIAISQCNNIYIFPAVGLGLRACGARRVTDSMMLAAAGALAANSPARTSASAVLLPALSDLRRVAQAIAFAVAEQAQKEGLAAAVPAEELQRRVMEAQWVPEYASYLSADKGSRE